MVTKEQGKEKKLPIHIGTFPVPERSSPLILSEEAVRELKEIIDENRRLEAEEDEK